MDDMTEMLENLGEMRQTRHKEQAFRDYELESGAIVGAAFGRSGGTMLLNMLYEHQSELHFGMSGREDKDGRHLLNHVAWPDGPYPLPKYLHPAVMSNTVKLEHQKEPFRIIKTHLEADYVPHVTHANYFVMVRDPADVFRSSMDFFNRLYNLNGVSQDELLSGFVGEGGMLHEWARHTASWWNRSHLDNTEMMCYNETVADRRSAFETIDTRLRLSGNSCLQLIDDHSHFGRMNRLMESCSLENMRENGEFYGLRYFGYKGHVDPMLGEAVAQVSQADRDMIHLEAQASLYRLGAQDFPFETMLGRNSIFNIVRYSLDN